MVGRGAQGNPWALREIVDGDADEPSREEVVAELVLFVRETVRELGERRASGFLKKFYGWYLGRGRFPRPFKQELVVLDSTDGGRGAAAARSPGRAPADRGARGGAADRRRGDPRAADLRLRRRLSPRLADGARHTPSGGRRRALLAPLNVGGGHGACCGKPAPRSLEPGSAPARVWPTRPAARVSPSGSRSSRLVLAAAWVAHDGWEAATTVPVTAALLVVAAAAERIVVQLGPRSWYTASTPTIVLAALLGGPLVGFAAGSGDAGGPSGGGVAAALRRGRAGGDPGPGGRDHRSGRAGRMPRLRPGSRSPPWLPPSA